MYQSILVVLIAILIGCSNKGIPTKPNAESQEMSNRLMSEQSDDRPGPPPQEPFNITVTGLDTLPLLSWQRTAVKKAVIKWEEVITAGLPDFNGVDDIVIEFQWGNSEWLASGYASYNRPGNGLPYLGFVKFHPPMLESNIDSNDWEKITLHEICHAIGFSWWEMSQIVGMETISGTRYFKGEKAASAYRQILFENGEKMAYAIPNILVPMSSSSTHWNAEAIRWDLMAPYYFNGNILTNVTIQALADMGYTVDDSHAENPPARLLRKPALPRFYCDGQHTTLVQKQ